MRRHEGTRPLAPAELRIIFSMMHAASRQRYHGLFQLLSPLITPFKEEWAG